MNLVTKNNRNDSVLQSLSTDKEKFGKKYLRSRSLNNNWSTVVTIVLIEAKNISTLIDDGTPRSLYCKLRLGLESYKSKSSPNIEHPEWRETLKMHLYHDHLLHISLQDRGKQKNSFGSCVLDLSKFEKETTHELWIELDDGPGKVHLSITMCTVRSVEGPSECMCNFNRYKDKYKLSNIDTDLNEIGVLHVKLIGARGLGSKPSAYCTLQLDNQKVQTHKAGNNVEIVWNRCYMFKVHDVTSTLDLKVYESSLANALLNEPLGKVSVPLLRVSSGERRWYALKDRNKRNSARGHFPRLLLQMSLVFHPVKATIKLFQPKEEKHIKKGIKFDIALLYSNVVFVSNVFNALSDVNEFYKRVFEWDDQEFSFFVLLGWIMFCYYIQIWLIPLLLLLPFAWHWLWNRHQENVTAARDSTSDENVDVNNNVKDESDKGLMSRLKINDLQQVSVTVTRGIEMIASYSERAYNLISFKVPFMSYVAMILLIIASIGLYVIPFNYIMMSFGIFKFTRKYINPNRVLNNDILDFFSRIPDDAILKDWKELHVPKPDEEVNTKYLARSVSTSI
ncbi:multiple C2 and transmembrane domain-containing protein-like [Zerene cesonia]|uniref:multiple C2 and transmembrane domain-containing protein-like n=1 Tax=Zerene cesonia TaxID=33412 RepID=UPI0018E53081|nr:multiple C2 and transmembrane domain-containing protein-like [Zerene cesonia]